MDFSREVNPAKNRWFCWILIGLGVVFFGLGIIGIVVPLLPTTPFLLLSAACFGRADARFYNWLMNHYILGTYIRDWRSKKGIPLRTKVTAIFLILVSFGFSTSLIEDLRFKLLFCIPAVGVILYILKIPVNRGN